MFSGVGGFELGIQTVATKSKNSTDTNSGASQHGFNPLCVGYSEIDKYAIQTYEKNWKGHRNYGDATKINERELPDFDLLVGGFPCQAFSIAGKRKGFDDTRGTLFFDIARIVAYKRPGHLVLENVQGLLSHDSGKTFQTILGVLADLGYRVEWQVLNGKRWVPQNRVRVIIVGHLRGECFRKIFPFRAENTNDNGVVGKTLSRAIEANYFKGVSPKGHQGSKRQLVRTDKPSTPERGDKPDSSNGIRRASYTDVTRAVLTPDRKEKRQNGRRMKDEGEPMFTLNTQDTHGVAIGDYRYDEGFRIRKNNIAPTLRQELKSQDISKSILLKKDFRIRRLTPLECERLMGWPDNWTEGVSDTQRYKQCGNGIIAPMVTEVMNTLINEGCLPPTTTAEKEKK